jgi:glycine/D-amino acid oxidase-like deaminating enzyme
MMPRRATGATDVAVVGGGIVGAATAAFLAGRGLSVRLYERTEIAAAASGRNSGVVQHPFDPLLAELYHASLALYRGLETADPAAFRLGPEPAGLLAVDATGGDAARATAEAWRTTYPTTVPELLDGSAIDQLEPGLAPDLVACRLAIGFPVGPATATRAFAAMAARAGAEVRTATDVQLAVRGGTAQGVAADGRVEPAGAVVVAAGPWTPSLLDPAGRWRPIHSVWGVVAAVRLAAPPRHVLEEAEIDIEPEDGRPVAVDDPTGSAFGFSLVTADGSSALGSTFLEAEPAAQPLVAALRTRGARFVPALAGAEVVGVRSCARPVSADRRPLVGPVPGIERAYVAAGHGPWGISTGPATARLVAELVAGDHPTIPAGLDPARFGAIGR